MSARTKMAPPPRSHLRTLSPSQPSTDDAAPSMASLTALPTKVHVSASERLAARRASNGVGSKASGGSTSRLSTGSSSSQASSSRIAISPSSSAGSLNRRAALARKPSGIVTEKTALVSTRPRAVRPPPLRTRSELDRSCTSGMSRSESQASTASSPNATASSPSDNGTHLFDNDTDATSDLDGSNSSKLSLHLDASSDSAAAGSSRPPHVRASPMASALELVETPKRVPASTRHLRPLLLNSNPTGLGILTYSTSGVGEEATDLFESVKGLIADIGETIGASQDAASGGSTPENQWATSLATGTSQTFGHGLSSRSTVSRELSKDSRYYSDNEDEERMWKLDPSGSSLSIADSTAEAPSATELRAIAKADAWTSRGLVSPGVVEPASQASSVDKAIELAGSASDEPCREELRDQTPPNQSPSADKSNRKRVWGFFRPPAAASQPAEESLAVAPVSEKGSSKPSGPAQTTPILAQGTTTAQQKSAIAPSTSFAKFSQQLSGLASGFTGGSKAKPSQAELDQDDELRVRLPRRQVDEQKLAELMIRCAEAKHVLRTDSSVVKLREVGLKLEEGWREQLSEAQALRSRLEMTQDAVEDLEDENKQLRTQLGTLSEQIVLREDDLKLLQQASVEQMTRERALWEEESKQSKSDNQYQLARVRRLLAEERALSAHLELLLASSVVATATSPQASGSSASLLPPAPSDNPGDDRDEAAVAQMSMSESQSSMQLASSASYQSMPSFEIHDADSNGSPSRLSDAALQLLRTPDRLARRISTRSNKDGSTEYELLFHMPQTPGSSRPSTTLFTESPMLGHLSKLGRLSPLLSPYRSKEATAQPGEADSARPISACPTHRIVITDKSLEGVPDSVSKLSLLEHKVIMLFGTDAAYMSKALRGMLDMGAAAIAVACASQQQTEAVIETIRGSFPHVKYLSLVADVRSIHTIESALNACISEFDGLDCIVNAYRPEYLDRESGGSARSDGAVTVQDLLLHFAETLRMQMTTLRTLSRQRGGEMATLDVENVHGPGSDASDSCGGSVLNVVFEPSLAESTASGSSGMGVLFGEMYKQAVFGLSKRLAVRNQGPDVRVNCMVVASAAASASAPRQGQPDTTSEDRTISYLLSDLSEFVNGAVWASNPWLASCTTTTTSSGGDGGDGGCPYTCVGPPLCATEALHDPDTAAVSRAALIRARTEATRQVLDEDVLKTTRVENGLLHAKAKEQEERIRLLECEVREVRERLRKTEEAVSGLF